MAVPDLEDPAQRSQALLRYCVKLHDRGDLQLAAGICNRAHELDPTNPAPLIELARVFETMNLPGSAVEAYRAALLLDPEGLDALYGLARTYIGNQRYDLAMEPLKAAVKLHPTDTRAYNALGVIMDQQGDHTNAQAYYREGLAHNPRNISLRNNLGLSLVLDGQAEAGLAMLREVAAEPMADAATGRNLELAMAIAERSRGAPSSAELSTVPARPQAQPSEPVETQPLIHPDERMGDTSSLQEPAAAAPPHRLAMIGQPAAPTATAPPAPSAPSPAVEAPVAAMPMASQMAEDAPSHAPTSLLRPHDPAPLGQAAPPPPPHHAATSPSIDAEMAESYVVSPKAPPPPPMMRQSSSLPSPVMMRPSTSESDRVAPAAQSRRNEAASEPEDWSAAAEAAFSDLGHDAARPDEAAAEETPEEAFPMEAPARVSAAETEASDLEMMPASTPEAASEPAGAPAYSSTLPAAGEGDGEASGDWYYTVQLASYHSAGRAREGWQILQDAGGEALADLDAIIVRADLGIEMGIVYRVRTAQLRSQAEAEAFCQTLKAKNVDCMPVKASMQETQEALVDAICQSGSTSSFCPAARQRSALEAARPPGVPG